VLIVTKIPIKRRNGKKFAYRIFARKISCHHYYDIIIWHWKICKPTRKKHANFILEYFEYFCQMSSKSILIMPSYTVSSI